MYVRYCSSVGIFLSARSARSLRTMTTVTPEGPRFFCAPAKIRPNFFTSMGREAMSEDMSAASGTSPVSGMAVHCVPSIVLLVQMCRYEASDENLISSGRGRRGNFFHFLGAGVV